MQVLSHVDDSRFLEEVNFIHVIYMVIWGTWRKSIWEVSFGQWGLLRTHSNLDTHQMRLRTVGFQEFCTLSGSGIGVTQVSWVWVRRQCIDTCQKRISILSLCYRFSTQWIFVEVIHPATFSGLANLIFYILNFRSYNLNHVLSYILYHRQYSSDLLTYHSLSFTLGTFNTFSVRVNQVLRFSHLL